MTKISTLHKTLYLFRHGKSDWSIDLSDKNRPILPRAHKDIKLVCFNLKKHFSGRLHLISSTALRATETASLIGEELKEQVETIFFDEKLYTFNHTAVLQYVRKMSNNWNTIMLVGHNPAFTELIGYFTQNKLEHLPTSGLVQLDFPEVISWSDVHYAELRLKFFPKLLKI